MRRTSSSTFSSSFCIHSPLRYGYAIKSSYPVPCSPSSQNFFLGTLFENGGVAILLSALSALYQMTVSPAIGRISIPTDALIQFAGFFVHLTSIPPVLRWLQWLCPLKYCLEALSVNEVGAGLMIEDTLEGVPVNVSASLIMEMVSSSGGLSKCKNRI